MDLLICLQIQDMNTKKEAEKTNRGICKENSAEVKIIQGKVNETVQEALDKNHENWDSLKKIWLKCWLPLFHIREYCVFRIMLWFLDEKYMRYNISTAAFKSTVEK